MIIEKNTIDPSAYFELRNLSKWKLWRHSEKTPSRNNMAAYSKSSSEMESDGNISNSGSEIGFVGPYLYEPDAPSTSDKSSAPVNCRKDPPEARSSRLHVDRLSEW